MFDFDVGNFILLSAKTEYLQVQSSIKPAFSRILSVRIGETTVNCMHKMGGSVTKSNA